ncbi:MAG: DUF552 domain-containing protein [Ruminococcaceae bacterium]|nr:DUF552 domain-containing protein [Oscillospiraceae bacterium]
MGFVDTLKEIVGFGDVEDEYEEEEVETEAEETPAPSAFKRSKVVPMNNNANQTKIVILKPKCFSNSTAVADELKQRRPVVIDVGALDPDEARRVVDFIAGTVYGQDGNMQKVSGGIFLATPSHMDIMGEILKDGGSGNFEWSMF